MNNINCVLEDKRGCFGCRACANACPKGCIEMREDEVEGFFYPCVDESQCCDCGLCKRSCPSLNKSETFNQNTENPLCLAAMAKDEIRIHSSSGGVFSLLANKVFEEKGVVCGVAFDADAKVRHILIERKEELWKLRGSKYVQSNTNTVYTEIKKLLKSGRVVLFSGTPCQVAGLNVFLGKSYDNLYTIDIMCHGVPSQRIFNKYIEGIGMKDGFVSTSFRDKIAGWGNYYFISSSKTKTVGYLKQNDSYFQSFVGNMCLRPSCGACPFTTTRRESDITLGDFWAIGRFDPKLNDKGGTSLVLLHSSKGKKLFGSIEDDLQIKREVPIDYAKYYNVSLYRKLVPHPNRKAFFRLISRGKTFKEATRYCLKNKCDCAIISDWTSGEYGKALSIYALQKAIRSWGYLPRVANFWAEKGTYKSSNIYKFAAKYMTLSSYIRSENELYKLNDETTVFISYGAINSSEVTHSNGKLSLSCLAFADETAKKISYAWSLTPFIQDNEPVWKDDDQLKLQYQLAQFDHISVCEEDGHRYLKRVLDADSQIVSDPLFLLHRRSLDKIADRSAIDNHEKYVINCCSNSNIKIAAFAETCRKKIGLSLKNIPALESKISIEEWLKLIRGSEFIITDSFYVLCLALIFNRPFVAWQSPKENASRYLSLLKVFGLENHFLVDVDTINVRPDIFAPIDWNHVNKIIDSLKTSGEKWLKKAMISPKNQRIMSPANAVIKSLTIEVMKLKEENILLKDAVNEAQKSDKELLKLLLGISEYRVHQYKYYVYRFFKFFAFGQTRKRLDNKMHDHLIKMKAVDRKKKGTNLMLKQ